MSKKKKNEVTSKNFTIYNGASTALPTMMDEYSKECERANKLDSKANFLITVLIALLTVYVPIIPFQTITTIYLNSSKIVFTVIIVAIIVLLISLIIAVISFYKLIMIIKPDEYRKVDTSLICKEEYLKCDKDIMDKALCEHYAELIFHNSKVNDKKAENLSHCFLMIAYVFFFLLISTAIMRIV